MSCQKNVECRPECCEKTCGGSSNFMIVIVLYILLVIMLGACIL